jgi:predicted GIY-YIG superfamily endonuclease
MKLKEIDWDEPEYKIVDGVTMELDSHTPLDSEELVKRAVSIFEDNTPFNYYVYCFQFDSNKWYVGETRNLAQRINTHSNEKNIKNIETVEGVESREVAREREREMSYEIAIKRDSTEIYGGR